MVTSEAWEEGHCPTELACSTVVWTLCPLTQKGPTPKANTVLQVSRTLNGHLVLVNSFPNTKETGLRKWRSRPYPELICSEDKKDGCVQFGGKGCISGVSLLWTPCLRNWPGAFCFWLPTPGFFLCLLSRRLQKSLERCSHRPTGRSHTAALSAWHTCGTGAPCWAHPSVQSV